MVMSNFVHFGRQIALEGEQPALLLRPVCDRLLQNAEQLRQMFLGAIVRLEVGLAARDQIAALAPLRILYRFGNGIRATHDKKGLFSVFARQSCIGHVLKKLVG